MRELCIYDWKALWTAFDKVTELVEETNYKAGTNDWKNQSAHLHYLNKKFKLWYDSFLYPKSWRQQQNYLQTQINALIEG